MVKMIADKPFTYRSVALKVGDEFDVDDEHVEMFELIEHAHRPKGTQRYETRVMTARGGGSRRKAAA